MFLGENSDRQFRALHVQIQRLMLLEEFFCPVQREISIMAIFLSVMEKLDSPVIQAPTTLRKKSVLPSSLTMKQVDLHSQRF